MSKLEELINELCPNGVEYKNIAEVSKMKRGKSLTKSQAREGNIPVISGGKEPAFFCDTFNRNEPVITVAGSGAGAGYVQYFECPIYANDCFTIVGRQVNTKYMYYFLNSIQEKIYNTKKGGGVPHVHISDVENFEIPVPPLSIQKEIVRILDNFTELTAELEARKKQYEYYRDNLLEFNSFPQKKFGEIATIVRGASPRPISSYITKDEGVNWIKIGDVDSNAKFITKTKEKITFDGSKKSRKVKKGNFILSNSMSFGRPYILKIDGCIHDGWLSISNYNTHFISDFLYHLLNSKKIQNIMKQKASFGGAVQNLNADIVRSIELPIPPLEEQQRIVNILDKFDEYCNDITKGLPAEIEMRKKQYEYYRDKLLTFKRLEA